MQDLSVTLVQANLNWEDKKANFELFDQLLATVEETDVIILPEMFSTGFSMKPSELAEPMSGASVAWMTRKAKEKNAVITGSLIIEENGRYYNRLIWMQPDGEFKTYDKRHLFTMANEQNYYTAGSERLIVNWEGWKICPLVCYDLRFPVWCRNDVAYDLQLFVANWPERRSFHWKKLLQARAIENQAYTIGVNRVGEDGNGIAHSGDSSVIDPLGEIVFTQADQPFVKTFTLSVERLKYVREKFPFLQDGDQFEIK